MTGLTYIPIDTAARNGRAYSLRAEDETLHAGRWRDDLGAFVYSNGQPINGFITHYLARVIATPVERAASQ